MRWTGRFGIAAVGAGLLCAAVVAAAQREQPADANGASAQSARTVESAQDRKEVSQVRIVRLSLMQGDAQLDRNLGRGYEAAFANLPVTQGAKLRTGNGVAEVEFEDNSTLRITPHSSVSFEELGRDAAGATLTRVRVLDGMAYVKLNRTKGNAFTLSDGSATIDLAPGSHVRLASSPRGAELAVFDGEARVAVAANTPEVVGKKQTYVFDPSGQQTASLQKKTEAEAYDSWDKTQASYHTASFGGVGSAFGSGMFGANDLMYYGSFADLPGCGMMWRPYFASAAWDPFANGMWALYPGAGYSWVSPYPWGWLPFHSGMWQMCGGAGWAWQPGGAWYGLSNGSTVAVANRLPAVLPRALSVIAVKEKPLTVSGEANAGSFAFRKDSAGLGIPRETFGKLGSVSQAVARHDVVTTAVERGPMGYSVRPAGPAPEEGLGREGMQARDGMQGRDGMPRAGSDGRPGVPEESSRPMGRGGMSSGPGGSSPAMSSPSMSSPAMSSPSASSGARGGSPR